METGGHHREVTIVEMIERATTMEAILEKTDAMSGDKVTMRTILVILAQVTEEATRHSKPDKSKNIQVHTVDLRKTITSRETAIQNISKKERSTHLNQGKIKNLLNNLEGKENLEVDVKKSTIIQKMSNVKIILWKSLHETNHLKVVTIKATNAKIHLKGMKNLREDHVAVHLLERIQDLAHLHKENKIHVADLLTKNEKMKTIAEDEKMITGTRNAKMINIIPKMIAAIRKSLMAMIGILKPEGMIAKMIKGQMIETKTVVITEIEKNPSQGLKTVNVLLNGLTKSQNTKKEMSLVDLHRPVRSKAPKNGTKRVIAKLRHRDLVIDQSTIEL